MKFEWETMASRESAHHLFLVERGKVIGGWIVRNKCLDGSGSVPLLSESMVFIPDPQHAWSIDENEGSRRGEKTHTLGEDELPSTGCAI